MTQEELNLILQTYLTAQNALFTILERRGLSLDQAIADADKASQEFHAKNQARIKALEEKITAEQSALEQASS